MSDQIAKYQPLLQKFENDETLRITNIKEESTGVGHSYLSSVTRLKIIGACKNGSYIKCFVRKVQFTDEKAKTFTRTDIFFRNEVLMYEVLLPLLGPFGPESILTLPHEIILEDLRPLNFIVCERQHMLDFNHCKAVMQALAAFHASSMALQLRDPKAFEDLIQPLEDTIFPSDFMPAMGQYVPSALDYAIRSLESIKEKTESIQKSIEFFKTKKVGIYPTVQRLISRHTGKYRVLAHGDLWNSNVLFRHDSNGTILQVKFIDYQLSKFFSPSVDLIYFVYTSANDEVVKYHMHDMLEIYHNRFIVELQKLNTSKQDLEKLSFGWLKNELKNFGLLGFSFSMLTMNAMLVGEEETIAVDMDPDFDINSGNNAFDKLKITPRATERFRIIAENARKYL